MLTFNTRIPKTRKTPSQQRARETVEAIVAAAAHILVKRGYAKTSTNAIAQRAGVSIGSLYQYFPDRDAIIAEVLKQHVMEERSTLEHAINQMPGAPPRKVVRKLIEEALHFFLKYKELRKVLFHQLPEHIKQNHMHLLMKELSRVIHTHLLQPSRSGHVELARINKQTSTLEIYLIINAIEASLSAVVYRFGKRVNREELIDEITDIVLNYLERTRRAAQKK